MNKVVYRLEQALRYWEDSCFAIAAKYKLQVSNGEKPGSGLRGLLVNFQHLRKSMLEVFTKDRDELMEQFIYPVEAYDISNDMWTVYFPFAMLTWSRFSRRVYSIDLDLQMLLEATSLQGVTWSDVHLPFECFAITLDKPLRSAEGTPFDCILVTMADVQRASGPENQELQFVLLDSRLENYKSIASAQKDQISSFLERGILRKAERAVSGLFKGSRVSTSVFVLDSTYANVPILDSDGQLRLRGVFDKRREDDGDPGNLWASVMRIVAGTCLYLKTLPARSPYASDWRRAEPMQTNSKRAITDVAEVCAVSSQFKLTCEERVAFGGTDREPARRLSSREKCCHFRSGAWRRPEGHGDDPSYPRTVWQRPAIVRLDKLKPGELPKGANTILLR